jgi:hypothetical protein
MEEKMSDIDDYVDLLKWVYSAERKRQTMFESSNCEEIPMLLQIHKTEGGDVHNDSCNKLTASDINEEST